MCGPQGKHGTGYEKTRNEGARDSCSDQNTHPVLQNAYPFDRSVSLEAAAAPAVTDPRQGEVPFLASSTIHGARLIRAKCQETLPTAYATLAFELCLTMGTASRTDV